MSNWVASFLAAHPELAGLPVVKRARRALHLRLLSGEILGQFTGAPCHYQQDGQWLPLDTALQLDTVRNEYGAPGLQVRLSPTGLVRVAREDDPDITLHRQQSTRVAILDVGDGSLSQVKTLGGGAIDGDSLVRSLAGGLEHRLRLTETGLRETLRLTQGPPAGSGNQWLVIETVFPDCDWPDGWVDGELAAGVERLGVPTGTDAAGNEAPCRRYARKRNGTQFLYTGVPLAWLASAAYPVIFDPDFSGDSADGYVRGQSTVSNAQARATSNLANNNGITINLGQTFSSSTTTWTVYRSFLRFDTSSIGSGANVLQANLALVVTTDSSIYADFDVQIVKQAWAYPLDDSTREASYDDCLVGNLDDSIWRNTSGLVVGTQYTSGNLSPTWVNKNGFTYYSLRSSRDAAAVDLPTGANRYEYLMIPSANSTPVGNRPRLTVLYAAGAPIGPVAQYYRRRRAG